jgi:hypothetical protein
MSEQDDQRHNPDEPEQLDHEEQSSSSEKQKPPGEEEDGRDETTVSLLALMHDISDEADDDKTEPLEEETAEIPTPLIVKSPRDEDSPTVTIAGETTATRPSAEKPPQPAAPATGEPPATRPLERDPEATEVQPRIAFPGSQTTVPPEEAPTEIHTSPARRDRGS